MIDKLKKIIPKIKWVEAIPRVLTGVISNKLYVVASGPNETFAFYRMENSTSLGTCIKRIYQEDGANELIKLAYKTFNAVSHSELNQELQEAINKWKTENIQPNTAQR